MFSLIYQYTNQGQWDPNDPPDALSFPVTEGCHYLLMAQASVKAGNHTVGAVFTVTDASGTQVSGGSAVKSFDGAATTPMVLIPWQCTLAGNASIAISNDATAFGAYEAGSVQYVSVSVAEIDGIPPTR